jgi:FkbM family methyltransferase
MRFHEIKYTFIRTRFEQPLMRLRHSLGFLERRRHPELSEIHCESQRIEMLLRKIIHRDTNCVDVGCHYGSMLSRFCALAPDGRHIAIEAIPWKVHFLRRKFPDVEVQEAALSDHPGIESFYINLNATGFSGLARHGEGRFERINVECMRLDDVLPQDRRFGLLKLDVEGAELPVLRGASEFLARDRPALLFECGPSGPSTFGYTCGELHDWLSAKGYSVFHLKDALGCGSPISRRDFEAALVYPFMAFNWLALSADQIAVPVVKE